MNDKDDGDGDEGSSGLLKFGFQQNLVPKDGVNNINEKHTHIPNSFFYEERFQVILEDVKEGRFIYPIAKLSADLRHHQKLEIEASRRDDFDTAKIEYQAVTQLSEKLAPLKEAVKVARQCMKDAELELKHCRSEKDYDSCKKWKEIVDSCTKILEKVVLEEKEVEQAKKPSSATSNGSGSNMEDPIAAGDDDEQSQDSSVQVVNKAGESVSLNSVLSKGKSHKQSRKRKKSSLQYQPKKQKKDESTKSPEDEPISQKKFEKWLGKGTQYTDNSQKNRSEYFADKYDHSFHLIDGLVHCRCCDNTYVKRYKAAQHMGGDKHKAKLKKWKNKEMKVQETIRIIEKTQEGDELVGQSLPREVKMFRYDMLKAGYKAGISINQLGKLKPTLNTYCGLSLGNVHHLPTLFGKALQDDIVGQIRRILKNSFHHFGVITDGTPSFAKVEAIAIRIITLEFDILDIVVHIKLFDKSLNAEELSNNIISCLVDRLGLDIEDWLSAMCDRASTNVKAIRLVSENLKADPTRRPCMPHTICKVGEKFDITEVETFRQRFDSIVQYKGKATDIFNELFDTKVKRGTGVRWWVKWEQLEFLCSVGFERISDIFAPRCVEGDASVKTSQKLIDFMSDLVVRAKITMQLHAAVELGRPFCQSTYILEGNDPLVFTAHMVLSRIDTVTVECIESLEFDENASKALSFMNRARNNELDAVAQIDEQVTLKQTEHQAKRTVLDGIIQEIELSNTGRRRRRVDYASMDRGRPVQTDTSDDVLQDRKQNAEEEFDIVDSELVVLQQEQTKVHSSLEQFDYKHSNLMSIEGLKLYAKMCVKPGIDYYHRTFNTETGDLYRFKKACQAAQIFDPFYLSTTPKIILEAKVKDLVFFDHAKIFTNAFIGLLIAELPPLIREAKKVTRIDWNNIDGETKRCDRYDKRLAKRQERRVNRRRMQRGVPDERGAPDELDDERDNEEENNAGEGRADVILTYQDWKDDPGERARRISLWWKHIIITLKIKIPTFAEAYRTVAVTQVSSALVERVFSHLSKIVNSSSQCQLEETIDMRLILEVNKAVSNIDL